MGNANKPVSLKRTLIDYYELDEESAELLAKLYESMKSKQSRIKSLEKQVQESCLKLYG